MAPLGTLKPRPHPRVGFGIVRQLGPRGQHRHTRECASARVLATWLSKCARRCGAATICCRHIDFSVCQKTYLSGALMTHQKPAIAMLAVGLLSFTAGTMAQGRYGEINQSIASLQTALAQMRAARDVFGGHKGTAENLVRQAIGELQAGEAFAASHGY